MSIFDEKKYYTSIWEVKEEFGDQFSSILEFDAYMREVIYTYKYKVSPNAWKILKLLGRLSKRKFGLGICRVGYEEMMKEIDRKKTVTYGALKELEDEGIITRIKMMKPKRGGNAVSAIIFNPDILNKNDENNNGDKSKTDKDSEQSRIEENVVESREETTKNENDFLLPNKKLKYKYHLINVGEPEQSQPKLKWIKGVAKQINQLFAGMFQYDLKPIWNKIIMAIRSVCPDLLDDKIRIGEKVIRSLVKKIKESKVKTLDEKCAYVYFVARAIATTMVEEQQEESVKKEEPVHREESAQKTEQPKKPMNLRKPNLNKVIRREMLPDWFKRDKDKSNDAKDLSTSTPNESEDKAQFEALISKFKTT